MASDRGDYPLQWQPLLGSRLRFPWLFSRFLLSNLLSLFRSLTLAERNKSDEVAEIKRGAMRVP